MAERPTVMISSTARDLPAHREEVLAACARQGMFPLMMEHLPASPADAIAESLRMVDAAEIYLAIFAYRYGYVPDGHDISITEMEYNRAVERNIPCLIFLIHDEHDVKGGDVEKGAGAVKLEALKARLGKEVVVNFFKSPADLRALAIDSLSRLRQPNLAAFHYVRDIPAPPEPYIAHPYVLLQTSGLVGRQRELNVLTDWVAKPSSDVHRARILNVVAIGGMGKSALTWKWFNDIASLEMQPLAGRFWWSFYESDASFENFVIRALAYVSRRARADIEQNTKPGEREDMLLQILDREPFLLVLDGLERIMIAYARLGAAHMLDDDLDQQTVNQVAGDLGVSEDTKPQPIGRHQLRKTSDPRTGNFLRKLAQVRTARVLVSTRLYPADLQTDTGQTMPGCFAYFLGGLHPNDALNLWRALGVNGSSDELLLLFDAIDYYPLLIRALSGEVARYRRRPGDFDLWRHDHPTFDPFSVPLIQVKSHVLAFALRGLNEKAQQVLYTIAASHLPSTYSTLVAIIVKGIRSYLDETDLDLALTELEDRGLLGWDKQANRYDLHPLVRGVIWNQLDRNTKQGMHGTLHAHFRSLPHINRQSITHLEDLTAIIEQYNALIGMERYDDACYLFRDQLSLVMRDKLGAYREQAEMLEAFFPEGLDQPPRLNKLDNNNFIINLLAVDYHYSGQPRRASQLLYRYLSFLEKKNEAKYMAIGLCNLAHSLPLSGSIYDGEVSARQAIVNSSHMRIQVWEATSLQRFGFILCVRGLSKKAVDILRRSLQIFAEDQGAADSCDAYLVQLALWQNNLADAQLWLERVWKVAYRLRLEHDLLRARRLQGILALALNKLTDAEQHLHDVLVRIRSMNLFQEEFPTLIALAELHRRQGRPNEARALLDDVWEAAERGPYPLFHADALNVLAQIERDAGNAEAATTAATRAYALAWCDGPPYAYHWGLEAARAHLHALGAPEPAMPPFDASKYEPMPEVEIDPPDAAEGAEPV